jgi:hypothetical protein
MGCVLWGRACNSRGYGVVWHEGKLHLAHRVAFKEEHGRWPHPGLVVDHICNTKACVNPQHLRELTNDENVRRAHPMDERRARARAAEARYRAKKRGE